MIIVTPTVKTFYLRNKILRAFPFIMIMGKARVLILVLFTPKRRPTTYSLCTCYTSRQEAPFMCRSDRLCGAGMVGLSQTQGRKFGTLRIHRAFNQVRARQVMATPPRMKDLRYRIRFGAAELSVYDDFSVILNKSCRVS